MRWNERNGMTREMKNERKGDGEAREMARQRTSEMARQRTSERARQRTSEMARGEQQGKEGTSKVE
ncbi:hypothetical protein BC629DRAFT_1573515 [Irpex lacteus]|nr:hypothetical protein BC629DRAFT_1573515 [Irpex lacteus]